MDKRFFGMHLQNETTPWPALPIGAIRLWDSGTAWAEIETVTNGYWWDKLDRAVTRASIQDCEVLYTFGRTPQWLARNPNEPGAYGPGQCSPPASWATWEAFVRAVVSRYKGRIAAYELWNEPDMLAPKFWAGTPTELFELCQRAAAVIRVEDPAAKIVGPGFVNSTGAVDFIQRGGADFCDVIAVHGYLFNDPKRHLASRIQNIRTALVNAGMEKPIWVTEWSWGKGTAPLFHSEFARAQYLATTLNFFIGKFREGMIERVYWYAYDSPEWGTLWSSQMGERLAAHVWRGIVMPQSNMGS